jgi:PAS domain S-box-containing protein
MINKAENIYKDPEIHCTMFLRIFYFAVKVWFSMIQLRDIMTPVYECIFADSTLYQAIEIMEKLKWNTVPVTKKNGELVGVFTRSILFRMLMDGKKLNSTIGEFIRTDIVSYSVDTPYEIIEQNIEDSPVGTAVIFDHERKVIGLITQSDIVNTLLHQSYSLRQQLESILITSQLGAVMTDEKKQIVFVNQRFCSMTGCSETEMMSRNLTDIISNEVMNKLESDIHQRLQIGSLEVMMRLSRYKTVKDREGFIALFHEISEVEKMAYELESVKKLKTILQTVIENAYDGIVMVNEKGIVTFLSPSLGEFFGLEKLQRIHQPIDNILPQLALTRVLKSGVAELSDFMEVNGINYFVHRIPVYQDDRVIGAIGKIMFRQLREVRERFKRFDIHELRGNELNGQLRKLESSRFTFEQIVTEDDQMKKLIRSVSKAAKGRSTILIRGESGTGKELFAHAIHSGSIRYEGPFVTVNCAAIPEHLLESEFFGYEEGAFTGAKHKGKVGKFDMAHGGTLFLDEVGDMSLTLQAKLLRVLQEREFYRVGGTDRIGVDVRIISATNRPLEDMVENGSFREDLFHRLNVISFEIPALRYRKKDIFLLCKGMIKDLNRLNGTSITGISPEVMEVMLHYDWPGNIRELRNVLERSMVFAESGKIQLEDLPDYILKKTSLQNNQLSIEKHTLLKDAEQAAIIQALEKANGNKTKAAQLLGISRSVLYEKLKKY